MSESTNRYLRLIARALRLEWIYVYLTVILSAGTIAYILNASLVSPTATFVRSLQAQSLIETVIYVITVSMGAGGFYLIARSGADKEMKRESGFLFLGGFALIFISFIMIFSFWSFKVFG